MRKVALFSVIAFLFLLAPRSAATASWMDISFYDLLERADDVLIVWVPKIDGPDYGAWAQAEVAHSFKGIVVASQIRLPFSYLSWLTEDGQGRVSYSTALEVSFKPNTRYLVLVRRRPEGQRGGGNPYAARTEWTVFPYPLDTLFELQGEDDPVVRQVEKLFQVHCATSREERLGLVREMLQSGHAKTRSDAADVVRELELGELAPVLLDLLDQDSSLEVRAAASRALAPFENPAITPALLRAARTDVAHSALQALALRADPDALPTLLDLYKKADIYTRTSILQALYPIVQPSSLSRLIRFYRKSKDKERGNRSMLLWVISAIHTPESANFVANVLKRERNPSLRWSAIKALGAISDARYFDEAVAFAPPPCARTGDEQEIEYSIFSVLRKIGPPEQALKTLSAYLACPESMVRALGAHEIGQIGTPEAEAVLRRRLAQEEDESVRRAIRKALQQAKE